MGRSTMHPRRPWLFSFSRAAAVCVPALVVALFVLDLTAARAMAFLAPTFLIFFVGTAMRLRAQQKR